MEMKELQPIITLITEQENRLAKKIDRVHEDVRDTNEKITIQNGRLRTVEAKVLEREVWCALRANHVDDKFEKIEPAAKISNLMHFITKNPKITGLILFSVIFASQAIILMAIENKWISTIFKALMP